VSIQIGDIIIRKLQDGDAEQKRYRVVGQSKYFYICRTLDDHYTECFLKTDLGKEVFKT